MNFSLLSSGAQIFLKWANNELSKEDQRRHEIRKQRLPSASDFSETRDDCNQIANSASKIQKDLVNKKNTPEKLEYVKYILESRIEIFVVILKRLSHLSETITVPFVDSKAISKKFWSSNLSVMDNELSNFIDTLAEKISQLKQPCSNLSDLLTKAEQEDRDVIACWEAVKDNLSQICEIFTDCLSELGVSGSGLREITLQTRLSISELQTIYEEDSIYDTSEELDEDGYPKEAVETLSSFIKWAQDAGIESAQISTLQGEKELLTSLKKMCLNAALVGIGTINTENLHNRFAEYIEFWDPADNSSSIVNALRDCLIFVAGDRLTFAISLAKLWKVLVPSSAETTPLEDLSDLLSPAPLIFPELEKQKAAILLLSRGAAGASKPEITEAENTIFINIIINKARNTGNVTALELDKFINCGDMSDLSNIVYEILNKLQGDVWPKTIEKIYQQCIFNQLANAVFKPQIARFLSKSSNTPAHILEELAWSYPAYSAYLLSNPSSPEEVIKVLAKNCSEISILDDVYSHWKNNENIMLELCQNPNLFKKSDVSLFRKMAEMGPKYRQKLREANSYLSNRSLKDLHEKIINEYSTKEEIAEWKAKSDNGWDL